MGLGDTSAPKNVIGDEPNEMENLSIVDLGAGRSAISLALGYQRSCALLDNHKVKCWGFNELGYLGLGTKAAPKDIIGDEASDMGDSLPVIDLGADKGVPWNVKAISSGDSHTCAILSNDRVKCWGMNMFGQVGKNPWEDRSGKNLTFGDQASDMGDNLHFIDLGTEDGSDTGTPWTVKAISTRGHYTCAILSNDRVKCWGANERGQLGLGHSEFWGDGGDEEMGNNLPFVDLTDGGTPSADEGMQLTVKAIAAASRHTCAILSNDRVKCWGANGKGQLGQEHHAHLGDESDEMGDNLDFIDLGTEDGLDTGAPLVAKAIMAAEHHTCVILENDKVKCWGINSGGHLGLGLPPYKSDGITATAHANIGDEVNEMGNDLSAVDLGMGLTAKVIAGGRSHTCAILSNERVKCWGRGDYIGLGMGSADVLGDEAGEMGDSLPFLPLDLGANED